MHLLVVLGATTTIANSLSIPDLLTGPARAAALGDHQGCQGEIARIARVTTNKDREWCQATNRKFPVVAAGGAKKLCAVDEVMGRDGKSQSRFER